MCIAKEGFGRPDRRTEIEADLSHRQSRDYKVQARARLGSLRKGQRYLLVDGDKPLEGRPQAQHRRMGLIPRQHIERPQQQMNAVHRLHARLGAARLHFVEVHRIAITRKVGKPDLVGPGESSAG